MNDKNDEFENVSVLLYDDIEEESSDDHYLGGSQLASKPIPMRNRSLSYSAPIDKDIYQVISQSPASKYLSEFTSHRDDSFGLEGFNEGRVVGNYLIGPVVGGGGFGQCRQAYVINRSLRSNKLPEKAALKIVTDPRCFRDFKKEVTLWRQLHHPNILPLMDYCAGPNFKIAVSPFVEGGNLQEYLAQKGTLAEEEAKLIFGKICEGIRYLHHDCRIAHLDVKLENILVLPCSPDEKKVFICDFGLSRAADNERNKSNSPDLLECNDLFCSGSITSLPPEVLTTDTSSVSEVPSTFEQKKKQDIWALGVLLYALVCGKLPFYDQFMPRLQHSIITGNYPAPPDHLSSALKHLISSLLNTNAHDRPDIKEVLNSTWFHNK